MNQENVPRRSKFVLRLIVVKMEGVLFPPPEEWGPPFSEVVDSISPELSHTVFSDWPSITGTSESTLREALGEHASQGNLVVDSEIMDLIDYACNHSPIRVALLSVGPSEWIGPLIDRFSLDRVSDLLYCADHYPPGDRRVLIQFLMNRFIAGRERTLFLGNDPADEMLADRENTRFRSLEPVPDQALNPDDWGNTPEQLLNFIKEKQPKD